MIDVKKETILMLAGALALGGCATKEASPHAIGRAVRKSANEPECYCVEKNDADMSRAVRSARRNVHVFIAALKNPKPGQRDFEVKKPFVQGSNVEHLWLSHVQFSGGRFQGQIDNRPQNITGLKLGQGVSVNPDEISDWSYVDDGKLIGGYTIRVLYNELSPERKKQFLKAADFRIEP